MTLEVSAPVSGGGSPVDVSVIQRGDYAGDTPPIVNPLFPWGSPVRLADPPDPGAINQPPSVAWSPNGQYVVIAGNASPSLVIYKLVGTNLIQLPDPGTVPVGPTNSVAWSPNNEFLAVGVDGAPTIVIYQRAEDVFTKLADPATLPANEVEGLAFSPNGEFLVAVAQTSPFVFIYQIAGTTFTKIADPASLPANQGRWVAWSPCGRFLAIAHILAPGFIWYERTGLTTFTKLSDLPVGFPGSLSATSVAWSPDSRFVAVGHETGFFVFERTGATGTTLTKLADPDVQPGNVNGLRWAPSGKFLVIAGSSSPRFFVYSFDGTNVVKFADPAALPASTGFDAEWSPDQQFITFATSSSSAPLLLYQTGLSMPTSGVMRFAGIPLAGT